MTICENYCQVMSVPPVDKIDEVPDDVGSTFLRFLEPGDCYTCSYLQKHKLEHLGKAVV